MQQDSNNALIYLHFQIKFLYPCFSQNWARVLLEAATKAMFGLLVTSKSLFQILVVEMF